MTALPSPSKAGSREPLAFQRTTTQLAKLWPAATMRPSGRTATVMAVSIASGSMSVTALPPVPKVGSRLPSGL